MIILPKFQKNRLIFRECSTASKFPMLSLWRIFVLRGSMRSECENTVLYISRCQNLIITKLKFPASLKNLGYLGCQLQRVKNRTIFTIFDPLQLATQIS